PGGGRGRGGGGGGGRPARRAPPGGPAPPDPAIPVDVQSEVAAGLQAAPILTPEKIYAWARDPYRRWVARAAAAHAPNAGAVLLRSCAIAYALQGAPEGLSDLKALASRLLPADAALRLVDASSRPSRFAIAQALLALMRHPEILGETRSQQAARKLAALRRESSAARVEPIPPRRVQNNG
ncbi:MAG: hypothetical protein ACFB2Z_14690, partial [Maricaulaceae bacterium]